MKEKTVEKLFDLKGKTCLITGAGGYLGGAMARALAEAGGRVVVTSRNWIVRRRWRADYLIQTKSITLGQFLITWTSMNCRNVSRQ